MYKEIDPSTWTYDKEGDFIEGILVQKQENIGANDSMLYSIETPEGVKNIWGATILDQKMAFARIGSKLKITYKGLTEAKPGKNAAKVFKVEMESEDEVPVVKVEQLATHAESEVPQ